MFNSRMTQWCTRRSMAAAVVIVENACICDATGAYSRIIGRFGELTRRLPELAHGSLFRSYKPRFFYLAGTIRVALGLSTVPAMMAQSTPAPEWSVVTLTTIKPEMRSEYEAF